MKVRHINLESLARAVIEITGSYNEKADRALELHVNGKDPDIKLFASYIASHLLHYNVTEACFNQWLYMRKSATGVFIYTDEKMRDQAVDDEKPLEEFAIPHKTRSISDGIFFIAHPSKTRMYMSGEGGVTSSYSDASIEINIRAKRPDAHKPQLCEVKIRAKKLPENLRVTFKRMIGPPAHG